MCAPPPRRSAPVPRSTPTTSPKSPARPACTPAIASSSTAAFAGATPSISAALRKVSGAGELLRSASPRRHRPPPPPPPGSRRNSDSSRCRRHTLWSRPGCRPDAPGRARFLGSAGRPRRRHTGACHRCTPDNRPEGGTAHTHDGLLTPALKKVIEQALPRRCMDRGRASDDTVEVEQRRAELRWINLPCSCRARLRRHHCLLALAIGLRLTRLPPPRAARSTE